MSCLQQVTNAGTSLLCAQQPSQYQLYLSIFTADLSSPTYGSVTDSCCLHLQVVMTYWKEPEPSDWSEYAAKLDQLWHKPNWAKSIYVDNQPPVDVSQTRPLHTHLQQLSAKACRVCDRQAHRPFPSNAALAKHVREQHKQHLCHVCLEVSLWHNRLSMSCSTA